MYTVMISDDGMFSADLASLWDKDTYSSIGPTNWATHSKAFGQIPAGSCFA